MEPVILDTFKNLFPRKPDILEKIKENMKEKGFSKAHPIILGNGPWIEGTFILDGHTRYDAAKSLKIESVYDTNIRYFETDLEAIKFAIYLQKVRRNMTDAEILSCIEVVDKLKSPGRPTKELASSDANLESGSTEGAGTSPSLHNENKGKSAKETADIVGTSTTKVEKARVILAANTPAKLKQEVLSGEKSINSASEAAKKLRKSTTTSPVIAKSPASTASWMPKLQVIINDVAAKKPLSKEDAIELQDKIKSLTQKMEFETATSLFVEAYFRKFDFCWSQEINRAEALPSFYLNKILTGFKNLVKRNETEAKKAAAKVAAINLLQQKLPGVDISAPTPDEAKSTNDDIETWIPEKKRRRGKTNKLTLDN